MRVVLASFVKHEEARRFAVGRRPRRAKIGATRAAAEPASALLTRATPPGEVARVAACFAKARKRSRNVPAAVRRAVYLRDNARCSFVSADGRRCAARALLELDHIEPWATLGGTGIDNIRLRCRAHNQLHARECFGARHFEAKIAK